MATRMTIRSALFISISDLLKGEEFEDLAETGQMTWGTNSYSLVSPDIFLQEVRGLLGDKERVAEIEKAVDFAVKGTSLVGATLYIDLEN